MIKLLVQKVRVWGRFHITLPFYTLFRCGQYNWDHFVLAMQFLLLVLQYEFRVQMFLKYIYYVPGSNRLQSGLVSGFFLVHRTELSN